MLTTAVTFAPGASKTMQVQLLITNDQIVEPAESVELTPSTSAARVNTTSTVILILDNDSKYFHVISIVYNTNIRVVLNIESRGEGEWLYIQYNMKVK